MNFLLEMLLTAILSFFFSFLVSKLVSLAMAGNSENVPTSEQAEEPDMDGFVMKMNVPVLVSERSFQVVDQNVETVEAESMAAVSPERIIAEDMIDDLAGKIGVEREELMVRNTEAVSTASVSPETVVVEEEVMIRELEERSGCVEVENEETGDVLASESDEVRIELSNVVEEKWSSGEEKEELVIEEDDDWEGIERSELEEAFMAAANYLEESGKAEEIGAEAKMELYGLHKIATEGSCREAQPMAVMVSARAKWNAWQKLGNMNQEEAMEQYLAIVSKEIPSYNEH